MIIITQLRILHCNPADAGACPQTRMKEGPGIGYVKENVTLAGLSPRLKKARGKHSEDRFKERQAIKPLTLNLEKLRNRECTQQHQLEVSNMFEQLEKTCEPYTPDELWQQPKEITIDAAKETLQKNIIRRENWISKDTFDTITKQRSNRSVTRWTQQED